MENEQYKECEVAAFGCGKKQFLMKPKVTGGNTKSSPPRHLFSRNDNTFSERCGIIQLTQLKEVTTMKVMITAKNYKPSERLQDNIEKKFRKLEVFFDKKMLLRM